MSCVQFTSAFFVKVTVVQYLHVPSLEKMLQSYHLPTYPPTCLLINLLTHLPTYLPTHLPTCPSTYLPTYLPIYLLAYLPTYLPAHAPSYLPTYLFIYLPANIQLEPFHELTTIFLVRRALGHQHAYFVSALCENNVPCFRLTQIAVCWNSVMIYLMTQTGNFLKKDSSLEMYLVQELLDKLLKQKPLVSWRSILETRAQNLLSDAQKFVGLHEQRT